MQLKQLILFIVNPFLSAINSFVTIRQKNATVLLYCWFIVFGMCFCAVNKEADSFRYYEDFLNDSMMSYQDYCDRVASFFTFQTLEKDIYTITVNFLVSRFTSNYHWVFLFYAIVFGYFYVKTIQFFLRFKVGNRTIFYLLLFLICISNPIFNINGVRFWTSAWISVYCLLRIAYDKKNIYILLLAITPLIHASYIMICVLFVVYLIGSHFLSAWMIIYILSSVVSAMSYLSIMENYISFLPDALQMMFYNYAENSSRIAHLEGVGEPLYARILKSLPGYFLILLSILLIINKKRIECEPRTKSLFTLYLILACFCNFTMGIPSTGVRFIQLTIPILALLWASAYDTLKKYNRIIFWGVPICFVYSLVPWFRNMMSVTEFELYLFPLPLQIFKYLF